jgi:hypothetical protein
MMLKKMDTNVLVINQDGGVKMERVTNGHVIPMDHTVLWWAYIGSNVSVHLPCMDVCTVRTEVMKNDLQHEIFGVHH